MCGWWQWLAGAEEVAALVMVVDVVVDVVVVGVVDVVVVVPNVPVVVAVADAVWFAHRRGSECGTSRREDVWGGSRWPQRSTPHTPRDQLTPRTLHSSAITPHDHSPYSTHSTADHTLASSNRLHAAADCMRRFIGGSVQCRMDLGWHHVVWAGETKHEPRPESCHFIFIRTCTRSPEN